MNMNEEPCWLCKERIEPWAANPGRWGVLLPNPDNPGRSTNYHEGCVMECIRQAVERRAEQHEAQP